MFKFLELEPDLFGLNISDNSVKLIKLKKSRGGLKLASWGKTDMNGIVKNGEIKDEAALADVIRKTVSSAKGEKIKISNIAASLPESKSFIQVVKMPRMDVENLKSAVFFEAENYIPMDIRKCYFDFDLISASENMFNVLIAAVSKEIVDSYFECFRKSGLSPSAFEVDAQSICRSVVKGGVCEEPLLIVDYKINKAGLFIFFDKSLVFTSSAAFSELKDLTNEIDKLLQYYKDHEQRKIPKILICGEDADLKKSAEAISLELEIPVEVANPWVNVFPKSLSETPGLDFDQSLGYSAAIGLALRARKTKKI